MQIQTSVFTPKFINAPLRWRAKNWIRKLIYGELFVPTLAKYLPKIIPGITVVHGTLYGRIIHKDGTVTDHGILGHHLIVTAGKNYVAGDFGNSGNDVTNLKFHGYGTGTTAAAAGDTALQTELTTQYATDNTRPTGSQTSSTNTYTTVATLSPDTGGTIAVTEWGLFTQAANSGGTLLDRQVFSAINLVAGSDSLQTTYVLTIS